MLLYGSYSGPEEIVGKRESVKDILCVFGGGICGTWDLHLLFHPSISIIRRLLFKVVLMPIKFIRRPVLIYFTRKILVFRRKCNISFIIEPVMHVFHNDAIDDLPQQMCDGNQLGIVFHKVSLCSGSVYCFLVGAQWSVYRLC